MPEGLPAVEQRITVVTAGYVAAMDQVLAAGRDLAADLERDEQDGP